MADAGIRWNDEEIIEGLLGPPQQLLALLVPGELQIRINREGISSAEDVSNDGMVYYEI